MWILNYSKLLCFIVASVSLTEQNLSQYTPNHTTHWWYGHTQPVSQQIPSPLSASWWPSNGKVGSHVQTNPTPKLSGDDNPDLPCSFVKVIPTVVAHSNIATTLQCRRKHTNYRVILFMALNLWILFFPFLSPILVFFLVYMPKHTHRNINSLSASLCKWCKNSKNHQRLNQKPSQKPTENQGTQNHHPSSSAHWQWSPGVEPSSHLEGPRNNLDEQMVSKVN